MTHVNNIAKLIRDASPRYDTYRLFSDAVATMAIALSNAVDLAQHEAREKQYMDIVNRYDHDTVQMFPRVLTEIVNELEYEPRDVLGEAFHELELHNKARGQFFTPYSLCRVTAEMQIDDRLQEAIDRRGFVSLAEPTVGAGAMVIAFSEAMRGHDMNPQTQLHVSAVDIDERAVHMAYVQFSLLGIPAVVVEGNSLTLEEREHWYTPAHILGGWSSRLRMDRAVQRAQELEADVAPLEPDPLEADVRLENPVQQDLFGDHGMSM